MKTTVSFEIPVHQKLTVGTNKTQNAAMCFLCVFNFNISSKYTKETIEKVKETHPDNYFDVDKGIKPYK